MNAEWLLIVHAASTWGLVGLIWLIQWVQYPAFAEIPSGDFRRIHDHHCRRISPVVGVLMALELTSALFLWAQSPSYLSEFWHWISVGLIGVHLLSTSFLQVPIHARLAGGSDQVQITRLVRTNWIRTGTWTARGILVSLMLHKALVDGPIQST